MASDETVELPLRVLFYRMTWMFIGPTAATLIAVATCFSGGGWLSAKNGWFVALVAAMIASRWLEFGHGAAQTAYGESATRADLYRYTRASLLGALVGFIVANVIGNHLVGGGAS